MAGANRSKQRRRRRRSTAENPSLSSIFPDELIEAILLRLPVSSLLRFKSVSKSWLSLISNPQFAKSQFDLAASPTHRLLLNVTDDLKFESLDIDSSPPNDDESAVLNYLSEEHDAQFIDFSSIISLQVLGSCRGFLLLPTRLGSFIVCNPSTGVQRRISSTGFSYSMSSLYGIGYDESTDDYLLVSINSFGRDRSIKLFSLKTNLPCSLPLDLDGEYHPYLNCESRNDLFLHGSLHWLVISDMKPRVVLAFDLVGKSLSEIPLSPDLARLLKKKSYSLREMTGCLGLCEFGYGGMAEIWIMKEYKVQSSWTKIVFSTHDIHTESDFCPICFTKCGDVFGSDVFGRLFRLNDKGKLLAVWSGESKYGLPCRRMYTPSLLSLPVNLRTNKKQT